MAVAPERISASSQVQVGKEHLTVAEHRAFLELRFLDLHDQLRGEGLLRAADGGAGAPIVGVREADGGRCVVLDDHLVAGGRQRCHGSRRKPDPVFVDLDFPWDPNAHDVSPGLIK
jgi:hypothetical protein